MAAPMARFLVCKHSSMSKFMIHQAMGGRALVHATVVRGIRTIGVCPGGPGRHRTSAPAVQNNSRIQLLHPTHNIQSGLPLLACISVRFKSDMPPPPDAAAASAPPPPTVSDVDGYIPDLPDMPTQLEPILNALGEPTLSSLGLCGWSPVGAMQMLIEGIHVHAEIPWWGALVLTTIVLRMCMFPVLIWSRRSGSAFAEYMPRHAQLTKDFQRHSDEGNYLELIRTQRALETLQKEGSLGKILLRSFAPVIPQMIIFVSGYRAMSQMSELPVPTMKDQGILWFTDLTIVDPYYILPVVNSVLIYGAVKVGADMQSLDELPPGMQKAFKVFPFIVLAVTSRFQTAILLYWCTSSAFGMLSAFILKQPAVKDYFGIPDKKPPAEVFGPEVGKTSMWQKAGHERGIKAKYKSIVQSMRSSMDANRRMANFVEKEDHENFMKAGTAPIQKTYKYNPKTTEKARQRKKLKIKE